MMKTYFLVIITIVLVRQVLGYSIKDFFSKFNQDQGKLGRMSDIFIRMTRAAPDMAGPIKNELLERNMNLTNTKNEENLLRWQLASLKITSPEKILALIDSEENCLKLKQMIGIVESDYGGCKYLGKDSLYMKLFDGAKKFHSVYCMTENFKNEMIKYQLCYQEMREDYIDCEGMGDWFESSNLSDVCETYKSIIECNYVKTAEICGDEAAYLLTCLSKPIFNTVLIPKCNFPEFFELEKLRKSEALKAFSEIGSSADMKSFPIHLLVFIFVASFVIP